VTRLALRLAVSNPIVGGPIRLNLALPHSGAASIDLIDLAGRRVSSLDVGGLGAGRHTVDLGDRSLPPPGIYVVRLVQGTGSRTLRLVVTR
jgi:hypothetical protein